MKKISSALISILFLTGMAHAVCIESGSNWICYSWADLKACIESNYPSGCGVDGNIIILSSDNSPYIANTTIKIPSTIGVTIKGTNNEACGLDNSACSTRITGSANPKFDITINSTYSTFTRISGFDFYSGSGQAISVEQTTLWGDQSAGRYRIDHCRFYDHPAIYISGNAFGVTDNVYVYRNGTGLYSYVWWVDGRTGRSRYGANTNDLGSKCWIEPVHWGSPYFHFLEDSTIEFTEWAGTQNWADTVAGGKRVMRYLTVINGTLGNGHDA